jgi:hypothetical protein
MFVVVKNLKNTYYVVHSSWLSQIDDDGKVYAYFPSESKMMKCLLEGTAVKDKWKYEEVIVQLRNIKGMTIFFI